MTRFRPVLAVLGLACALAGCKSPRGYVPPYGQPPLEPAARRPAPGELTLDRGDWLLGDQSAVWKVFATTRSGERPRQLGYVVLRKYREMRGGPEFTMYEVTSMDRDDQVGLIDSLGRAKRFRPRVGGGIDVTDLASGTLENGVGAIFGEVTPVTLERTTERRIAFDLLDANRDGALDAGEWPRSQGRDGADRNGDGRVDFAEFDAIDRL